MLVDPDRNPVSLLHLVLSASCYQLALFMIFSVDDITPYTYGIKRRREYSVVLTHCLSSGDIATPYIYTVQSERCDPRTVRCY